MNKSIPNPHCNIKFNLVGLFYEDEIQLVRNPSHFELTPHNLSKPISKALIFPPILMAESKLREVSISPMGGLLPLDLISLILARLPVKFILRSKCVCKLWHALITSPEFSNLHLLLNSLSNNDPLLILAGEDRCLYSFSLESPEYPAAKIPNFEGFRFSNIVGSCNGLMLCICGEAPNLQLVLVNPSTRSYRRVPNLQVPQNYMDVSYGFGFDSGTNDYKVVRIVHLFYGYANGSAFNGRQVMVYSFRYDSWRMVEEDICHHKKPAHRNGVLVNNHMLHWLLWYPSQREHRIASFDVCSEKWSEVPMPDYVENGPINPNNRMAWRLYGMDKEDDMVDLGVLDGHLCLLTKNYRRLFGEVDVWVMKEYGVKDSWVRLFDASDLDITGSLEVAPIAYSNGGSEILLRTFNVSRVFWYNLREKRARSADFQGVRNYCQVNVCIPSLVSLPGPPKENQLMLRHEEY